MSHLLNRFGAAPGLMADGVIATGPHAGRPARRLLVAMAGLACITLLTIFWSIQGAFRSW